MTGGWPPISGLVGCALTFEIAVPTTVAFQVGPVRRSGLLLTDRFDLTLDGAPITATVLVDGVSRQHVVHAQRGTLAVSYEGSYTRSAAVVPEPAPLAQQITALRPSRYCPSDRTAGFARSHFGDLPTPTEQVRAICRYVWDHIAYEPETSGPGVDAVQTLLAGRGVCRDFAHLVVTLCRGLDLPARMSAVYAPGLSPMDFHAVAEVVIDGAWWCFDATRLAPRSTLVRIATGRDAADVAFVTTLSGHAELSTVEVRALAPGDLPYDDHEDLVALG